MFWRKKNQVPNIWRVVINKLTPVAKSPSEWLLFFRPGNLKYINEKQQNGPYYFFSLHDYFYDYNNNKKNKRRIYGLGVEGCVTHPPNNFSRQIWEKVYGLF